MPPVMVKLGSRPLNSGNPFAVQVAVGSRSLNVGADVLGFSRLCRSTLSSFGFRLPSAPHEPHCDHDGHDHDEHDEDDEQVVGEAHRGVARVSAVDDNGGILS